MSYTIRLEELGDAEKVYRSCANSPDPIFISAHGREEMVLMNLSVYRDLYAKLQVYQKLEEGEADIAAGRESNAFDMLDRVGAHEHV